MENSQTEAEKREETSVKPGERLTTASAVVAKLDSFQNINGGASRNDLTLDEKTHVFFIVTQERVIVQLCSYQHCDNIA